MLKFKKMGSEKIPLLLITANVGSIFESPSVMLPMWTTEFLQTIAKLEPKFIALHMQEVGGKTYEKSMQYVEEFVKRLCDSPELRLFDKIRIYLDEDYSSAEKFTALGNIYFVHSTLTEVKIWNFVSQEWVMADGKEVHAGNIEKAATKEKAKFPQHFFPECKWSRKGFMRVRWMVRGTAFELVNVHLFHDASNIIATESTPSVYCRSRRRALRHTLEHLHQDSRQPPFFIFGDFNFRPDTAGIVKKLTENLKTNRVHNGKSVEHTKMQFRNESDDKIVLTVGKKEFCHIEHQKVFREPWVLKFDKELDALKPHLYEFPIKFPPSYPFEENVELPTHFMKTRCPAWCDRILLSQTARLIINHLDGQKLVPRDPTESRRSIVEQMDGVLKHGSRRSIAESVESSGGSPSKCSHRSSGQSSSESSPARSASPNKYGNNASPAKKSLLSEFDGLAVPSMSQSRKSIADPTNIVHAMNSRANDGAEGSPTKRRLVRNQSEGSPKMSEHLDLRKMSTDGSNPSLRKRVEYGIIGESTCMGDHKPVYLRILLQSDKGIVRCCMQDEPDTFCYIPPPEIPSETCFRHPSAHNLSKCPSRECFEPLIIPNYRSRLASQISYDSSIRGLSKLNTSPLIRLGTDPSLAQLKNNNINELYTKNNDFDYIGNSKKVLNDTYSVYSKENIDNIDDSIVSHVKINVTRADYINYDGIVVNNIDPHLLCCANIPIDPYTPESIDSHSPYPEPCSETDSEKQSIDKSLDFNAASNQFGDDYTFCIKKSQSIDRTDYSASKAKSVSPRQLKSRLENILRIDNRVSDISNDVEFDSNDYEKLECANNLNDDTKTKSHKTSNKIKMKAQNKCKCFGCNIC